jgi:hypothetical protein
MSRCLMAANARLERPRDAVGRRTKRSNTNREPRHITSSRSRYGPLFTTSPSTLHDNKPQRIFRVPDSLSDAHELALGSRIPQDTLPPCTAANEATHKAGCQAFVTCDSVRRRPDQCTEASLSGWSRNSRMARLTRSGRPINVPWLLAGTMISCPFGKARYISAFSSMDVKS